MSTILVGMNNPINSEPKFALYPHPEGCTGHRIWTMLDAAAINAGQEHVSRGAYCRAFERTNILSGRAWVPALARKEGRALRDRLLGCGRNFIVVGAQSIEAMGLPSVERCRFHLTGLGLAQWGWIPHASGRNLWYNEPGNAMAVGKFLLEAFRLHEQP